LKKFHTNKPCAEEVDGQPVSLLSQAVKNYYVHCFLLAKMPLFWHQLCSIEQLEFCLSLKTSHAYEEVTQEFLLF
jgi:hypothetical protein